MHRYLLTWLVLGVFTQGTRAQRGPLPGVERFRRERLPGLMDVLCPYNTICRDGQPMLPLDQGKDSCCEECSCLESCGLNQNCCFPDQDIYKLSNRSHEQCLAPSTDSVAPEDVGKFYMVVDRYPNGSGEVCGTGNTSCGDNEAATPLGSLYPVSSRTTGSIYKNEMCAQCHGVGKDDQIPWDVVMVCISASKVSMSTILQTLGTGQLLDFCFFDFYYPGKYNEVKAERCYDKAVHTCKHIDGLSYRVPEQLNMTDGEIWAACLSDLQATYRSRHHFFNVFCFICNYGIFSASNQCPIETSGERWRQHAKTFSAIVNPNVFASIKDTAKDKTSEHVDKNVRTACKLQDELESNAKRVCKPVLCPSGQILQDNSCVHSTIQLLPSNFHVYLNLYPREIIQAPHLDSISSSLQAGVTLKTFLSAPGIASWSVKAFCYNEDWDDISMSIRYFAIHLTTVKHRSSLQKIVANVARFTTRDWTLLVNGTAFALQARLSKFESLRRYNATTHMFVPSRGSRSIYENSPLTRNYTWPLLTCLILFEPGESISITKAFFCHQVALDTGEYILDGSSMMLYVNATARLFFPAEYSVVLRPGGVYVPQLCLEDAEYALTAKKMVLRSSVGLPRSRIMWLAYSMVHVQYWF